jgi:hypothetical protein
LFAASAFDEVTEFCYFEYCGLGSRDEKQTSRWCYVLGIRRLARAFTQLRMIFTCSLRQATVREPWVDEEHVKCTAHQIPNEFRIAYSAQAAIVLSQAACPFEVVGRSTFLRCATDHFIPAR